VNSIPALIAAAGLTAPALAQAASKPPEGLARVRTSFKLIVHAPYAVAGPLFGANGERAWAGEE
jgi:hypothetical protein